MPGPTKLLKISANDPKVSIVFLGEGGVNATICCFIIFMLLLMEKRTNGTGSASPLSVRLLINNGFLCRNVLLSLSNQFEKDIRFHSLLPSIYITRPDLILIHVSAYLNNHSFN